MNNSKPREVQPSSTVQDGEPKCKYCDQPIRETHQGRVRNEWEHMNGLSFCEDGKHWAWPSNPKPAPPVEVQDGEPSEFNKEAAKWKRRYELYCTKKLPPKTWEQFILGALIAAHDSLENFDNIPSLADEDDGFEAEWASGLTGRVFAALQTRDDPPEFYKAVAHTAYSVARNPKTAPVAVQEGKTNGHVFGHTENLPKLQAVDSTGADEGI